MKKTIIRLGSESPIKLAAIAEACRILNVEATISGIKVDSEQNEQPYGFEEIYSGAYARAENAISLEEKVITMGIESGIVSFSSFGLLRHMDIAAIVILDDARVFWSTTPALEIPEKYIQIAQQKGFKQTVGAIIAEELGGDKADPHSILTAGATTRRETLVTGIITALNPLIKRINKY
jgi:non-canonical (house-cleaning) NTP pyrophosphatase